MPYNCERKPGTQRKSVRARGGHETSQKKAPGDRIWDRLAVRLQCLPLYHHAGHLIY